MLLDNIGWDVVNTRENALMYIFRSTRIVVVCRRCISLMDFLYYLKRGTLVSVRFSLTFFFFFTVHAISLSAHVCRMLAKDVKMNAFENYLG